MRLPAGSWPWLLRHEMRLAWRQVTGQRRKIVPVVLLLLLWLGFHVVAWLMLEGLSGANLPPAARVIAGMLGWLLATLMLSQAILHSVSAVFDRGDLDLLLSSPLPARRVFVVRGLAIAAASASLWVLFIGPFAHVGLLTGRPQLLAIYPALVGLALFVTGCGLMLTLVLVRWLGARRARAAAQVLGALAGAVLFLGTQLQNMLSAPLRRQLALQLKHWTAPGGPLGPDSMAWLPSRAAFGDPVALLVLVAAGLGVFWLVVTLAHRRFVAGTQESVTGDAKKRLPPSSRKAWRFRRGVWRNVLVKEWRLILRDPQLIAQTLMQVLYMLPLVFFASRRHDMLGMTVPATVLLAGTLSATLAWITVAAEEAPELVGAAPVPLGRIRWIKVVAAMVPVWMLVSPLAAYMLFSQPLLLGPFLLSLLGVTASTGVTQVWYPRRGDRKNLNRRPKSGMLMNVLEFFTSVGWAGVAWCLIEAPAFAPLGLVVGLTGPAAAWWLGKERRAQGLVA